MKKLILLTLFLASCTSNSNWTVLFDGEKVNGLRGYRQIHFSGEKKIVINAESRTIFWENTYIILGSAAFIDIGYIWKDIDIDIWNPKRSIGFGLRFSSPKLSGFQVYRLDLAFPLDRENRSKPVISYAVGQAF